MPGLFSSLLGSITGANIGDQVSGLNNASNTALGAEQQLFPESQATLSNANQAFNTVEPYYSGILSGNRSDIMSELSPEISTLQGQNKQAAKNISEFTPQGGGQTAQLSELPFTQSGEITNLISGARQQAAQGLTGVGQAQSGLGLGESGQAGNFLGLNEQALTNAMNGLIGKQSQATQGQLGGAQLGMQAASGGSDIADLLGLLAF
jgi:hypothetical protein